MNFLSTKQAAEKWGISPRRVALLAAQDRIPGAGLLGNSWLIPEDAEKPVDMRKRSSTDRTEERHRLYPFLPDIVYSDEQVSRFTPEEKELLRADLLHESGEFAEAQKAAESLLQSTDLYIRMGALYLLCFSCLYQCDFEGSEQYAVLFEAEFQSDGEQSPLLVILRNALVMEMSSSSRIVEPGDLTELAFSDPDLVPLVATHNLYLRMVHFFNGGPIPDISSDALLCRMAEDRGYYFCAMLMFSSMSMICSAAGDAERERFYMKRAVDLAVEHSCVFSMAFMVSANPYLMESLLSEYPKEIAEQFNRFSRIYLTARSAFAAYQSIQSPLFRLRDEDHRLISCCLKGWSVDQMAAFFGLSHSGMSRRLGILYGKLGVSSKKELETRYFSSLLDWNRK